VKKGEKITWIIIGIVFGVADLMALHNIYAADALLFTESVVLGGSFIVFVVLTFRLLKNR